MSNGPYFVRWRGKIIGPYSLDELGRLYQMGQVTKFHSVSSDQAVWTPAGEMAALNRSAAPAPAAAPVEVPQGTVASPAVPEPMAPAIVAPSSHVYTEPESPAPEGRGLKIYLIAGGIVAILAVALFVGMSILTPPPPVVVAAEPDALTEAAHAPSDSLAVFSISHPDKSLTSFVEQVAKNSSSPGAKEIKAAAAQVKESTSFDIFNPKDYTKAGIDLSHPISIVVQREVQGIVISAWALDEATPLTTFRKICEAQGAKITETGTSQIVYRVPDVIEMTVVKGRILIGLPLSRFAVDGVIKPFLQERDNPPLSDMDDFKSAVAPLQKNGEFSGYFSLARTFEMLPSWIKPPKVIDEVRGIAFSNEKLTSAAHVLFAKTSHLLSEIDGRQSSAGLLGRMGKPMLAMTFSLKNLDDFGRRTMGQDWDAVKRGFCEGYGIPPSNLNTILTDGTFGLALYSPTGSVKEPRSVFFIRYTDSNAALALAKQSMEKFGAVQRNDYGRNPKTDSGKNVVLSSSAADFMSFGIVDDFLLVSNDVEIIRRVASTTESTWTPQCGGAQIFAIECSMQQCLRVLRSYPDFIEHMKGSDGSELILRRMDELSEGDARVSLTMKNGGSGLIVSTQVEGNDMGHMAWMAPLFLADMIGEARARAHLQHMAKPSPLEFAHNVKQGELQMPPVAEHAWVENPSVTSKTPAGLEWQPILEMDRNIFPSYIIATANKKKTRMAGDPHELGEMEGMFGIRVRGQAAGAKIKVQFKADGIIEPSTCEEVLPKAGEAYLIKPKITYKFDKLQQCKQLTPITLTITVFENGVQIGERNETLSLRPINDCPIRMRGTDVRVPVINMGWMVAAYVNEDHPEVQKILVEAMKTNHIQSITGYQNGQVFEQVEAVWHALANRGIKYSSITSTAGRSDKIISQHVRLLEDSLSSEQANCVDGSVLFASILKKMGIDVYLVLTPNHCFVGFYLDAAKTRSYCIETTVLGETDLKNKNYAKLDSERAEQLRTEMSSQVLMYAINSATQRMEENTNNPMFVRIEIDEARKAGIAPIPFKGK